MTEESVSYYWNNVC